MRYNSYFFISVFTNIVPENPDDRSAWMAEWYNFGFRSIWSWDRNPHGVIIFGVVQEEGGLRGPENF